MSSWSREQLVGRARVLAAAGDRRILGLAGAPGAGKSTLAAELVDELGDLAVLVTMDGFHLANSVLDSLSRRDRKGAADTFDVPGYVELLARLRGQTEGVIYAPRFDRGLDESVGSAVPVLAQTPLVITEGNYLLHSAGGWEHVRPLLDEVWFLAPPDNLRQERLIHRHEHFGRSQADARAWALGTDQRNADLVHRTREAATLVIDLA
jgi:pantothenate kinase